MSASTTKIFGTTATLKMPAWPKLEVVMTTWSDNSESARSSNNSAATDITDFVPSPTNIIIEKLDLLKIEPGTCVERHVCPLCEGKYNIINKDTEFPAKPNFKGDENTEEWYCTISSICETCKDKPEPLEKREADPINMTDFRAFRRRMLRMSKNPPPPDEQTDAAADEKVGEALGAYEESDVTNFFKDILNKSDRKQRTHLKESMKADKNEDINAASGITSSESNTSANRQDSSAMSAKLRKRACQTFSRRFSRKQKRFPMKNLRSSLSQARPGGGVFSTTCLAEEYNTPKIDISTGLLFQIQQSLFEKVTRASISSYEIIAK